MRVELRGDTLIVLCPACRAYHNLNVGPGGWRFNGDLDSPTVSPSILNRVLDGSGSERRRCHSFLESGVMRFLGDCSHSYKNTSIPLAEVEE